MSANSSLETPTGVPIISDSITDKDMASSNFSQVLFVDVADIFPPKQDLRVSYIINKDMEVSSRDWVGLFKVGWTTPREYITFVWSPVAKENQKSIIFTAYYLPIDDTEFYQFCYVTRQGLVKGASTPFQFRVKTENSDLVEVEDENGMIVLKTKSAALEESLNKVTQNRDELQTKLNDLNDEKSKLETELEKTKTDLETTTEALFMEKETNQEQQKKIQSLEEKCQTIQDKLTKSKALSDDLHDQVGAYEHMMEEIQIEKLCLENEIDKLEHKHAEKLEKITEELDTKTSDLCKAESNIVDLEEKVKELTLQQDNLQQSHDDQKQQVSVSLSKLSSERDAAIAKGLRYKDEKDLFQKQFHESEESRTLMTIEVKNLKDKIEKKTLEFIEASDKVNALQEKINIINKEMKAIKESTNKEKMMLEKELSSVEDRLNASEASKRLISTELTEARESRDKLMSQLNRLKKEKEELQNKVAKLENERKVSDSILIELRETALLDAAKIEELEKIKDAEMKKNDKQQKKLKKQITLLRSQLEDADTAVAASQQQLQDVKSESATTQTEQQKAEDENVDDESVIDDLKTQIEDLRTRLSMGAAAYTEKYIECHKLEKKLKKIQATTKSPMIREQATAMLESTTTSDSQQEESTTQKKAKPVGKKSRRGKRSPPASTSSPPPQPQEQRQASGGMLGKLEQLFLAIADPDAEEQEHAHQLQEKLKDLERNVQFQHSKYKKYKLLFQEEKQKRSTETSALEKKVKDLEEAMEEEKKKTVSLENENKALQAQVGEFVEASNDENVIKTKSGSVTNLVQPKIIPLKFGNPYITAKEDTTKRGELIYGNPYIKPENIISKKNDASASDSSDSSSLEYGNNFLSFCPKNISSDDSDTIEITRPPSDTVVTSPTVTHQPIRSPPLIEVLDDEGAEPRQQQPIKRSPPSTTRQRVKRRSKAHKSYA